MPIVSIVVPAKNQESYIYECLSSLINQKYKNLDIIVIDDQSSDATRGIVKTFSDDRIRIINGPGKGIASCLNIGFSKAVGEIVMRCDADDRYPEDRVKKQVAWLTVNPAFDAICGAYYSMDNEGKIVSRLATYATESEISGELQQGITRTSLCTFAMRANAIEKIRGFRDYFISSSDIDFQLRFGEVNRVFYRPDFTYFYRIHDASITHTQPSPLRQFYEATALRFQQQRMQRGYDDLQTGFPPEPPNNQHAKADSAHQQIQGFMTGEAWRMHKEGRKKDALKISFQLLKNNPFDQKAWRHFLLLVVKRAR
jgi:glycosyltransferase involved in cell wall biosynthesis